MIELQDKITKRIMPQIEAVTPGGGVWQTEFFGSNYAKLHTIKEKYDLEYLLWSLKAVSSDYWNVAPNGRMCKA